MEFSINNKIPHDRLRCNNEQSYNSDHTITRYRVYAGGQVRWSAVDPQLHLERHRSEREVVLTLETLGQIAVATFLKLEALQEAGEH